MVGIIFINELKYSPYLSKYTDTLDQLNMEYEIIFWNRNPENDRLIYPSNQIVFRLKSREDRHPIIKFFDFFRFGNFVKKKIKERKYDKIVVLSSLAGIFLYRTLMTKYWEKYIFDYRDASYEYFRFYLKMIKKLVACSYFTCISSKGFLDILPSSDKYVFAHNFKYSDLKHKLEKSVMTPHEKIHLSYIGLLRETYLYRLIDVISQDNRFMLYFHGGGEFLNGAMKHAAGTKNVAFTGEYTGDEKIKYALEADIFCYNYESSFINDRALANKYYDALIFKKPLLGNSRTYSGQLIERNGLGISLELDDPEYTNKLYGYYVNLDRDIFDANAERELERVLCEDATYMLKIEEFCRET